MKAFAYAMAMILALAIAGTALLFPNEVANLIEQMLQWRGT
jgi:hypothetical protein